eukprot:CAMPEP_0197023690 /NCGR_PEP_ID=MMETSP1384-20130603/4351_1 /TAXON_ID=29189 /ORGANISM="Ammonia sp." /LENGTH=652 /DNA_ID=CAMNT_0042451943 /DNA_START=117 /DNA_END=2075 /DNA_ORIENTATION=-
MVNNQYVLMESALGFALFRVLEAEEISIDALSKSMQNFNVFKNMIQLESFVPFNDQVDALSSMNQISEGLCPESLLLFLKTSIPDLSKKSKKKSSDTNSICLGLADANLGNAILDNFEKLKKKNLFTARCDNLVLEIIRGCRQYLGQYIKHQNEDTMSSFNVSNIEHSCIALGHSYSRSKIKYNINRVDNMIIQAICILDQIDKDINTYCMRCKEWYGWHFPELAKIATDQIQYAKVMQVIKEKTNLKCLFVETDENTDSATARKAEEMRKKLLTACNDDEDLVQEIIAAGRTSMGIEVSKIDMMEMTIFALRIVRLAEFRQKLYDYLCEKMDSCAPNLTALIGQQVGARLISKAGSLIKLAKYPASTIQILGAEKALFRALKSKGACNTPKYGLIYNSTFIMKAKDKNKGRISRYLANKAAMAVRLDCFLDKPTNVYGVAFRDQVEQRLSFFTSGKVPSKNIEVMNKVKMQIAIDEEEEDDVDMVQDSPKEHKKKATEDEDIDLEVSEKKEKKKKKKDKKRKKSTDGDESTPPSKKQKVEETTVTATEAAEISGESEKKKKKKKKKKKDSLEQPQQEESTPPSKQEEGSEAGAHNVSVDESETKKKKKKKKKKSEVAETTQEAVPAASTGDDGSKKKKKKKKKKKSQDSQE